MSDPIRVGTVFSGIGAVEHALERMGIDHEVVFASDCDVHAKKQYAANFESGTWYDDVRDMDHPGRVDILAGGPPCQPFSAAGKREGLDDPRGLMIFEFVRILRETRPSMFLFENVPPLLTMDDGKIWSMLLADFQGAGYVVHHKVLNAMHYGIPQSRKRLFVCGFLPSSGLMSMFEFPPRIPLECTMGDFLEDVVPGRYQLTEKGRALVFKESRLKKKYTQVDGDVMLCQKKKQQENWNGDFVTGGMVDERFVLSKRATRTVLKYGEPGYERKPVLNRRIAKPIMSSSTGTRRASMADYVSDTRGAGVNLEGHPINEPVELVDEKYRIPDDRVDAVMRDHPNNGRPVIDPPIARTIRKNIYGKCTNAGDAIYVSDPPRGASRVLPDDGMEDGIQDDMQDDDGLVDDGLVDDGLVDDGLVDEKYLLGEKSAKYAMSTGTKGFHRIPELNRRVARPLMSCPAGVRRAAIDNYHTDPRGSGIRRLTPRECFRLMGFSDDYRIISSDTQAYRQAGNSMVVDVIEALLGSMLRYRASLDGVQAPVFRQSLLSTIPA